MLNRCYENENKIFNKIQEFCNSKNQNEQKGIKEFKIENIGYAYLLQENEIIFSPIKLNKITKNDFEEDNYFLENDNKIGYGTLIEAGAWILFKENEIRYTIKDNEKKLAVIKLKKENKDCVVSKYFSYSTRIENFIKHNLENCNTVMELINKIKFENDIYKEIENIGNKSLKFLIDDLTNKIREIENLETEVKTDKSSLDVKMEEIIKKYKKISSDLQLEFRNVKLTIEKGQPETRKEQSLLVLNSKNNRLISENKYILKSIKNLFKFNVKVLKSNFINANGGKNE